MATDKKAYDKAYWANMDPEKKAISNRRRREQVKADTIKQQMLGDFLRAKTPHEKREVIKRFAPNYFVLFERSK